MRIKGSEFLKSVLNKSMDSKNDEARIVGMDINSDKLTLLCREKPKNNPPEMVFPDLDVPGIRANACQIPIIKASRYDQWFFCRFLVPYLSDI